VEKAKDLLQKGTTLNTVAAQVQFSLYPFTIP
jgi:hypothetical protein